MTDDERFLVIEGRRWRRTDPSIPDALRSELVSELMDARRRVDRPRVHDAKVALGERGRAWWEAREDAALRERAAATMRALLNKRAGGTLCPSEVARVIGGEEWRSLMPLVREVAEATDGVELRGRAERGPKRIAQAPR